MRIVITGADDFIGTNLQLRLAEATAACFIINGWQAGELADLLAAWALELDLTARFKLPILYMLAS